MLPEKRERGRKEEKKGEIGEKKGRGAHFRYPLAAF